MLPYCLPMFPATITNFYTVSVIVFTDLKQGPSELLHDLLEAIKNGRIEQAAKAIDVGADPNSVFEVRSIQPFFLPCVLVSSKIISSAYKQHSAYINIQQHKLGTSNVFLLGRRKCSHSGSQNQH